MVVWSDFDGKHARKIREDNGLTRRELAKEIGSNIKTIARYESYESFGVMNNGIPSLEFFKYRMFLRGKGYAPGYLYEVSGWELAGLENELEMSSKGREKIKTTAI